MYARSIFRSSRGEKNGSMRRKKLSWFSVAMTSTVPPRGRSDLVLGRDRPQRRELVAQARDLGRERGIVLGLGDHGGELCAASGRESIGDRDREQRHGLGALGAD